MTKLGFENPSKIAFIRLLADALKIKDVSENIAKIKCVDSVIVTLGQHNILAVCLFDELHQLQENSLNKIKSIDGVFSIETTISVEVVKYNGQLVKIVDNIN